MRVPGEALEGRGGVPAQSEAAAVSVSHRPMLLAAAAEWLKIPEWL